jgi:hypothetical protein
MRVRESALASSLGSDPSRPMERMVEVIWVLLVTRFGPTLPCRPRGFD